jgi:hypothetical protein
MKLINIENLAYQLSIASTEERKEDLQKQIALAKVTNLLEGKIVDRAMYKHAKKLYSELNDLHKAVISASVDCILTNGTQHNIQCVHEFK